MKTELVAIDQVQLSPDNPRVIKNDKFIKLVKSIGEFPEMLKVRPIVVDDDMVVLGGNMRLRACLEAGLKEVYILKASEFSEKQKREFVIKDNSSFGEWDWDALANEWDTDLLEDWGIDTPIFMEEPSYEDLIGEDKAKPPTMKITFDSPEQLQKAEVDIQELLDRKYEGAYFSVSAGEI